MADELPPTGPQAPPPQVPASPGLPPGVPIPEWAGAGFPPFVPPPSSDRRLIVAVLVSAVLVAAGVLGAALVLRGGQDSAAAGSVSSSAATTSGVVSSDSTCAAWADAKAGITVVPQLPNDWTPATPGINGMMDQRAAAMEAALDLFEPRIRDEPAEIAEAARDLVAAGRKSIGQLKAHEYTRADDTSIEITQIRLNRLCGVDSPWTSATPSPSP